jgi:NAD(P)-dependent dehydrogenase (short-subunit alcohol dehydrogenase family)
MRERLCLITGGSSGVGYACALGLLRAGARVVLLGRNGERGERARQELFAATGEDRVELLRADLSRPAEVRQAAAQLKRRFERLDVLLNCAGVLCLHREGTSEGWERTFATEFLGHFLLSRELLPLLRAAAAARVLTVAGTPAYLRLTAPIDFGDLQLERRYNPLRAKLQAALAKALLAFELARRTQGSRVSSNAFAPGLVRSGLARELPWFLRMPAGLVMALLPRENRVGPYLATAPDLQGVSGRFLVGRGRDAGFPFDEQAARRLWEVGEELTGSS